MKNVLKNKEKVYTRLNVKTKYYAVIVALVLILPFLFRLNSPLPGDENYLIDRLSHTISENRNLYDDLSFGGMPITRPLGTILLFSLFNRFRDIAFVLLPIICGILSVILFVKILNKLNISKDIIFVSFFSFNFMVSGEEEKNLGWSYSGLFCRLDSDYRIGSFTGVGRRGHNVEKKSERVVSLNFDSAGDAVIFFIP